MKTNECACQLQKLKSRLVAREFTQTYGEDYGETFAPVFRHDTIRTLLAYRNKWNLHQMDVKSTFLNGEITEEVNVEQPQEVNIEGAKNRAYKLKMKEKGL